MPILKTLVEKVSQGEHLSEGEAEAAFDAFMDGSAPSALMGAFLSALRAKGEAPAEVAGGVRALRKAMIPVVAESPAELVDTAGTGGGSLTTFNISTAGALVAAGAGVRVAKHGNRSFTSRSGSADVLEALGVGIELSPGKMARVLADVGIVFMFAPLLHPAMRHVAPVRRELGFPTIMNLLGPLTNPAGVTRQVIGVSHPSLLALVVRALEQLGHERALVVHGEPGLDELSPIGPTRVAELAAGEVREYEVTPAALGISAATPNSLWGGEPEQNAEIILDVLRGDEQGGPRSAVLVNAAAAIYVADRVDSLKDGVRLAAESIDSGRAMSRLEALREATRG